MAPRGVCAVPISHAGSLTITAEAAGANTVLTTHGVLNTATYHSLRDTIIDAALDEPAAVIVDIGRLEVPAESALAVFTSARWHVATWPEVPILLVCEHSAGREAIARNDVSRYLQVFPTIRQATTASSAASPFRYRRRARAVLPSGFNSLHRARELVAEWLTAWAQPGFIAVTKVIATAFIENVLQHTESRPNIRLEFDGVAVTIAVSDASRAPAAVREMRDARPTPSGLRVVGALCQVWGAAPTPTGKTVWAMIGPQNRL